jgi:hypothetical protein
VTKAYYAVRFEEYKVAVIVLNNYDTPDDRLENGDFAINRGSESIRQEQMDWFVKTLTEMPEDYHVIVARHANERNETMEPGAWTQLGRGIAPSDRGCAFGKEHPIADIVDTWMRGGVLKRTYPVIDEFKPYLEDVTVDADFTKRGEGNFVCFLLGHCHRDGIAHVTKYPRQKIVSLASACADGWQNYDADLPRAYDTKAEDCLTVLAVNTINREICLVRVGSNVTCRMTDRTYIAIPY